MDPMTGLGDTQSGEDKLRDDIEKNLVSGAWPSNMRLPTERSFSEHYGIPRSRVRRVLDQFERDGHIVRTVGSGTFVADRSGPFRVSIQDIESVNPQELMEVRLIIEPQLAPLLVKRATIAEIGHICQLAEQGKRSRTMAEFEELDHRFHMALTLAAKNDYLTGIMTRIQDVRRSPDWVAIRRRRQNHDRRMIYGSEHEAIAIALQNRDAQATRKAIEGHLNSVTHNLDS
jgi:DNA-binding FadR family transcriptional regulator